MHGRSHWEAMVRQGSRPGSSPDELSPTTAMLMLKPVDLAEVLYVHPTSYRYDGDAEPSRPGGMTAIYRHLAADEQRTRQVAGDVLAALGKGRHCLVLTNRTGHLERFADLLREAATTR